MNNNIVFQSERINFVNLNKCFIDDYLELINDKEVNRMITHNCFTMTKEQELQWIKDNLKKKENIYTMVDKTTNAFIGNIGLKKRK